MYSSRLRWGLDENALWSELEAKRSASWHFEYALQAELLKLEPSVKRSLSIFENPAATLPLA